MRLRHERIYALAFQAEVWYYGRMDTGKSVKVAGHIVCGRHNAEYSNNKDNSQPEAHFGQRAAHEPLNHEALVNSSVTAKPWQEILAIDPGQ